MKHFALYFGLATALVASCSVQEEDFKTPQQEDVIYYASFEQPAEEGTRVYANEDLLLRWTADDRVSIFGKITYNQQYKFLGETGDNSGGFGKVDGAEYVTGNPISHTVSVYPYQASTKITEDEVLSVTLPAEQHYAENSFGLGASTMVSVSSDNVLRYKNVGGFLRISLYGEGVSVSSITLKGNNGEKLAGKATVTMPLDGTPTAMMSDDATDVVTLVCDSPVALGATAEESKDFWFVVPPVSFSKGFTVTVSGKGGVFEKSTEKTVAIERNKLSKMAPIEVELTPTQPRNVIYYTSSDGNVVVPYTTDGFGANILSNEYVDGLGVITFDGDVTSIEGGAFCECTSLTSISIPEGVTSIGDNAFSGCTSLTCITIPDGVTSIGAAAFSGCTSLTSITIPDGVTSIGDSAFADCTSLTSITIPEGVTSIGHLAFYRCTSLTSITIPEGVISIEYQAFYRCTSLTSITIPNSVTGIGHSAFYRCTSLTSITIPEGVTSIGGYAFADCTSLTSITIPEGVTSIGDYAFARCSSLMSFSGKFSSPDGLFLIDSGALVAVALGAIDEEVIIPDGVTSIGAAAFSGCTGLTSITIPNSVTGIGDSAFAECTSLTSISIPDGVTSIGAAAFSGCTGLTSITIPDGVTSIGAAAFSGCTGLTSITIPDGVTGIGNSAFAECTSLTSISIPDGVTSIGNLAFSGCTSLTSITIPEGVTSIGHSAFYRCTSLTSITIPDGVTSIGNSAFNRCTSLTSITVKPETPPTGGYNMFFETNNAPIYVPAESVEAYKSAQYWSDYADRIQAIPSPSVPVPEAIDLGLPSGVKWASFNLGASKPEEYGDYFAWGETEPHYESIASDGTFTWKIGYEDGYAWSNYKWCEGSYNTITKYNSSSSYVTVDNLATLDAEDDAATVNWGGTWRTPTDDEWTWLQENCTWTWTSDYNGSGVAGRIVTSKIEGYTSNSIFLPAAGRPRNPYIFNAGTYGYYWSSSIGTDNSFNARIVHFFSDYVDRKNDYRFHGLSVRPVCD